MAFLADRVFDVAIVGGGILGLSVARDCAMRRLSVALFERDDFASGATGSLPGLFTGEPHWLETDRLRTRRTCEEVQVFQRIAPNLLSRVPLLIPVLQSEPRVRLYQLEALGRAYDRYSQLKSGRPAVRLSASDALAVEPGLAREIWGAVSWDEWAVDLPRLAMLTGRSAASSGAQLFNRTPVEKVVLQDRRVVGLLVRPEGEAPSLVRARAVVNAAGAWSTTLTQAANLKLELRFAKSVHLEFDRRIVNFGITCSTQPTQRTPRLFSQEHRGYLGPVEEPHVGKPEEAAANDENINQLLHSGQRYFPRLLDYRVVGTRVSVRPYPVTVESQPKQAHILADHARDGAEGFYTVAGGNIAMTRRVAELTTDLVCRSLKRREPCRTHLESLPGCVVEMPWLEESVRTGLDPITVKRIMQRHGFKAHGILNTAAKSAAQAQTLCECEQVIAAEAEYCVRKEIAKSVADLGRRTSLGHGPCRGCRCIADSALYLGSLLGWSPAKVKSEIADATRALAPSEALYGEQARQADYSQWLES